MLPRTLGFYQGLPLTNRVTLVTQLTSRELVLLLAQDHGTMEWKWGYRSM